MSANVAAVHTLLLISYRRRTCGRLNMRTRQLPDVSPLISHLGHLCHCRLDLIGQGRAVPAPRIH